MRSVIRFAPVVMVLAVPALEAAPAWAQGYADRVPSSGMALGVAPPRRPKPQTPTVAPPPAIPGAQSKPGSVAPPGRPATDMDPNAALFDAIDRGDIAAARDALNRGADLNAQNVLGMSPIDLSIDLGRNDITFLLLSMRPGPDQGRPALAAARSPMPAAPPPPARHHRAVSVSAQVTMQAPAPPRTAPLFAHDGGTPVPQAGFLGFDPGSGSR